MRKALLIGPALLVMAGPMAAWADEVGTNGRANPAPAYEGRAADENGAGAGAAVKDNRHSIESAKPTQKDFPPSKAAEGP